MASIMIRNLDEGIKKRLRVQAAEHGRSMEEEVRCILCESVNADTEPQNLAGFIRDCFAPAGGVELELPYRGQMREPPDFD